MIGSTLAHYRITAKLGEGGMGEVYRATDSKLDREVAIKVLPAAFSEDAERLARFEREAKLLAQLHHPNIASIYGLEESAGTRALIMELVEGPTLAERLEHGALPFSECLSVALQIAHALEEAHEKGIVHRDLKPQNIKASIEGKTKVLDFGLAKAMDPTGTISGGGSQSQLAKSPTLTMGATVQGMILGTAAYMAPEQAAGGAVDRRADVWSFGVVLYEMLTGRRLFEGETVSHVLAGVLREEPDFSKLPAETPRAIRELVRRCLRKKPRERLQSIGDARLVLEEVLAGKVVDEPLAAPAGAEAVAAQPARRQPLYAAVAALALSTVGLGALLLLDRPAPPRVVRSSLLPPPEATFHLEFATPGAIALSPDGRQIAFTARDAADRRSLWVRNLAALEARELPGTEQAQYPFWSPDSQQVGFFNGAQLKKIAIAGGPPVTLAKAQSAKGGSWSPRGLIVFTPSANSGLFVIPAAGGEAKPLTELLKDSGDSSHRHPRFLPDGEHFLFVVRRAEGAELRVGALDGSPPVKLAVADSNAEYAAGRLLFVRESTLLAQPFDPRSRTLSGEAVPVAENVLRIRAAELAVFTTASDGTLAYQTGVALADSRLVWRDRAGKELGLLGEPAPHRNPRLSPDGASVAVEIDDPESGEADLWLYDVRRALRSRFTFDATADRFPVWSPDSQSLAFASRRGGAFYDIWSAPVGGTEPPRRLTTGERQIAPTSWSPDGQRIVAAAWAGGPPDVIVVPAAGGEPAPLAATEFVETEGDVSPDGRWLAYRSNESGRDEIYVTSFPTPGRKWQLSQGEGRNPVWRRDGRELFYQDPTGLHAAEVDGTRPVFEVGAVRRLFDLPPITGIERNFDVAADGQRFLIVEPLEAQELAPATLVLNWDAELAKP